MEINRGVVEYLLCNSAPYIKRAHSDISDSDVHLTLVMERPVPRLGAVLLHIQLCVHISYFQCGPVKRETWKHARCSDKCKDEKMPASWQRTTTTTTSVQACDPLSPVLCTAMHETTRVTFALADTDEIHNELSCKTAVGRY